jgi:hypothetical protein
MLSSRPMTAKTGFGIFQITNGSVSWMSSLNPTWAAGYAANLLASNMNYLAAKYTGQSLLQATAASYNMNPYNPNNFTGNPATIDNGTTNNNYGGDILLLMHCFD